LGDLFEQNGVENKRIAFRIAKGVFNDDFIDHAAFARPPIIVAHVRSGAQHPEPNFAGRVSTQHGSIAHQNHSDAGAGRGNCAAHACQSAADDAKIGFEPNGC
jgi:hypothetical protein